MVLDCPPLANCHTHAALQAEEVVRKELEDLQLKIEAETKEGMWR